MHKLSIITINYNNLEGLKRTVESVVNQTWQEFEYIVIDGGSTDGSAEYMESQSHCFAYWVSEPDTGIYNAMNKGIVKATGEYLLFLNSGDHLFCETVLEANHGFIKEKDLIYFNVYMLGESYNEIISYPDALRFSDFYVNGLNHQSTLVRKELFKTVGLYDENYKIVSDWKFFIVALFIHNCSYLKVNVTFSTYYLDGISAKLRSEHLNERRQVLKEYFGPFVLDYDELLVKRKLLEMNRFKMLREIEKSVVGKKMVSVFFRTFLVLFSKKRVNELLK